MNNFFILDEIVQAPIILRDASPMAQFLSNVSYMITRILLLVRVTINNIITREPMLMIPFGFIAITATISIISRILSRD